MFFSFKFSLTRFPVRCKHSVSPYFLLNLYFDHHKLVQFCCRYHSIESVEPTYIDLFNLLLAQ